MKKLVLLFSIIVFAFAAMAQTAVTNVTPNGYISDPAYVYIWGSTSDTLTNADTLDYVARIYGNEVYDFNIQLYSDHVSGTAGGTLMAYRSIDGVNYTVLDTITVSSLTADALDAEVINLDNFLYPYLKFEYLQTGTAVTVPKVYIYCKKN